MTHDKSFDTFAIGYDATAHPKSIAIGPISAFGEASRMSVRTTGEYEFAIALGESVARTIMTPQEHAAISAVLTRIFNHADFLESMRFEAERGYDALLAAAPRPPAS